MAASLGKLLFFTLNEGKLQVSAERLSAALRRALPQGTSFEDVSSVVVARQEATDEADVASSWKAALQQLGFPHSVTNSTKNGQTQIQVFSKGESLVQVVGKFGSSDSGGVTSLLASIAGVRFLLTGVHLDGNTTAEKRLEPLTSVTQTALLEGVDVCCTLGDMNFALDGAVASQDEASPSDLKAFAEGLAKEYAAVLANEKDRLVTRLPAPMEEQLKAALALPESREVFSKLDGSPRTLDLARPSEVPNSSAAAVIEKLSLIPLPPGSFPSYRLCNVDNKAFELLDAASGSEGGEDGLRVLAPGLKVSSDCIHAAYFLDDNKGHAGAIKKRGPVCRLNLGWLDRMYIGATSRHSCSAMQGEPILLSADDGSTLDHTLVSWLVEVSSGQGSL